MLNTFMTLEAQRVRALKDLDQLENAKSSALKRPYKFVKQVRGRAHEYKVWHAHIIPLTHTYPLS